MIKDLKDLYYKKNIDFIVSLIGPFFMFVIHLIATILRSSLLYFNYSLFFFILFTCRITIKMLKMKSKTHNIYLISSIFVILIFIPFAGSMVLTIFYKDAPAYLFDWFIYAYASYMTIKIINTIINVKRGINSKDDFQIIKSFIMIVSALFTVQMTEFALIATFSDNYSDMVNMQIITQGMFLLITIFIIIILINAHIKRVHQS